MTTTTTVHDSATCRANAGEPCAMCNAAIEFEKRRVLERIRQAMIEDDDHDNWLLPSFDDDWELAPLSMTRTTERECAEYWYEQGKRAERRELLTQQNSDLREMLRIGNERITR